VARPEAAELGGEDRAHRQPRALRLKDRRGHDYVLPLNAPTGETVNWTAPETPELQEAAADDIKNMIKE